MIERDEPYSVLPSASHRNINIETASNFAARGVSVCDFSTCPHSALAAITGIRSDYFSDEKRVARHLSFCKARGRFYCRFASEACFLYRPRLPDPHGRVWRRPQCFTWPETTRPRAPSCSVAIVGTRHCTPYGADFTRRLVSSELASTLDGSLLIVSGLAFGVDIAAHRAALEAGVPTAAVLAHGLNTIYIPADHRNEAKRIISDGGFLATEYRSSDRIHRGNFLARNRLIAALADVTVVVESDFKGGAMVTARIAAAYNRRSWLCRAA